MTSATRAAHRSAHDTSHAHRGTRHGDDALGAYLRFGAMIGTAMLAMYALTYVNSFALDHVYFSETRLYMTLLMGSVMAVIMLAFMRGMYRSTRTNVAIVVGSALVFALALWLVRSQDTVEDQSFMRAMIPHHSIAILTSERSQLEDVRVQQLAQEINDAQRREIDEMAWLIDDIEANGAATSTEQARDRPVPDFEP